MEALFKMGFLEKSNSVNSSEHKRQRTKNILALLIVCCLISIFILIQNNCLTVSYYEYNSDYVNETINIVQLSDLHGKNFGTNQSKLIDEVEKLSPDLIFFTGDLIDANRYDDTYSLILMEGLANIAPVYYVTGNHEYGSGNIEYLEAQLKKNGINILSNRNEQIVVNGNSINLIGIGDPTFIKSSYSNSEVVDALLSEILVSSGSLNILLTHRPELLDIYSGHSIDLVFSGHAHGGQFRMPLVGGLYAPNQGFLPKYSSGVHSLDKTAMIVNRGLGNSTVPLRLFNRPEIVSLIISPN